jgi:GPH family glycoside/pentoside/hexuronide:cation symporter
MMLIRLLNVLLDPLIDTLSDRTSSRWGRRKPWFLAGALIVLPAAWALFAIPPHAGMIYFSVSMGFAYIGWSMVEIPHTAWLGELSQDDAGRSALSRWRSAGPARVR